MHEIERLTECDKLLVQTRFPVLAQRGCLCCGSLWGFWCCPHAAAAACLRCADNHITPHSWLFFMRMPLTAASAAGPAVGVAVGQLVLSCPVHGHIMTPQLAGPKSVHYSAPSSFMWLVLCVICVQHTLWDGTRFVKLLPSVWLFVVSTNTSPPGPCPLLWSLATHAPNHPIGVVFPCQRSQAQCRMQHAVCACVRCVGKLELMACQVCACLLPLVLLLSKADDQPP